MATRININLATKDRLESALELGPDMAEAIFNYREEKGPFRIWAELEGIEGVTDTLISYMKSLGATI